METMERTVIWKLDTVYMKNGSKRNIVESTENSRKEGEKYIQRLKDDGEEIISVEEVNNKLYITLK